MIIIFLFKSEYRSTLNGMFSSVKPNASNGIEGTISAILLETFSSESFSDMDGLCTFETGYYRLRSGEVRTDSAGFVSSWE